MKKSIWKPMAGFPDYEINQDAEIRVIATGFYPKHHVRYNASGNDGNYYVNLNLSETERFLKPVKVMLVNTFFPQPKDGEWVLTHIDGNSLNIGLDNLCWKSTEGRGNLYPPNKLLPGVVRKFLPEDTANYQEETSTQKVESEDSIFPFEGFDIDSMLKELNHVKDKVFELEKVCDVLIDSFITLEDEIGKMKQQTEEPEKVTPEFFEIIGYPDYLMDAKGRILNKHTSDFLYIFEEDGERYVMLNGVEKKNIEELPTVPYRKECF